MTEAEREPPATEATPSRHPRRGAVAAVATGGLLIVITATVSVILAVGHDSRSSGGGFSRIETVGPEAAGQTAATPYQTAPLPPPEAPATGEHEKGDRGSFYLRAAGQDSAGTTVLVEEARFDGVPGWVAVHASAGGAPGEVIGVSGLLPAGSSTDVRITLRSPLAASAKVFVMLHREDNRNTVYDFPRYDQPVRLDDGSTLSFPIQVDVR